MRVLLLLSLCGTSMAQLPPAQTIPSRDARGFQEESEKTRQVDVVVTDGSKRPSAADFELTLGGQAQKIEKAEPVSGPRTVVAVVDDLGLTVDGLHTAVRNIRQFIDEQVHADDRVALLRTSATSGAQNRLSGDRKFLFDVLNEFDYNPLSRAEASQDQKEETLAVATMGTLRQVIEGLRDEPGRKAVVLFSENLRERTGLQLSAGNVAVSEGVDSLMEKADLAGVVFYAIDPVMKQAAAMELNSGLEKLARHTGGEVFPSGGDPAAAFNRVLEDLANAYVLSFKTAQPLRNLAIKTVRAGSIARFRDGVLPEPPPENDGTRSWVALDDNWRLRGTTMAFAADAIAMRITPLFGNVAAGGSYADMLAVVDARQISLIRDSKGIYRGSVDLMLVALGDNGGVVEQGGRTLVLELTEADYQELSKSEVGLQIRMPLPKPGAYMIRTVLRDDRTGQMGSAGAFLEAPDLKKPKLAISGIWMQSEEPSKTGRARTRGLRQFHNGDEMHFSYTIFHLAADEDKRSRVEIRQSLLADGRRIYNGTSQPVVFEATADLMRHSAGGNLTVGADMPPGKYVLEIVVTDRSSKTTPAPQVTQYIDFEVRP